jgi:hypothetical protein
MMNTKSSSRFIVFIWFFLAHPFAHALDHSSPVASPYGFASTLLTPDLDYFWGKIALGSFMAVKSELDPSSRMGVKPSSEGEQGFNNQLMLGLRPWDWQKFTLFAYYQYKQVWFSTPERMDAFSRNPTDFEHHPFRSDLLKRKHRLVASAELNQASWQWGLMGLVEQDRMGSAHMLEVDQYEKEGTLEPYYSFLTAPWVQYAWSSQQKTKFYLYVRKELNLRAPEKSKQSYPEETQDWRQYSFGLSHEGLLFNEVGFRVHASEYHMIYNDPWLDRRRRGFYIDLDYQILQSFTLQPYVAFFEENYTLPAIKVGGCEVYDKHLLNGDDSQSNAHSCPRRDVDVYYKVKLNWDRQTYQRFSLVYVYASQKNPSLREFDVVTKTFILEASLNFPDGPLVHQLSHRYYDREVFEGYL